MMRTCTEIYTERALACSLLIFTLSAVDAGLTLNILALGGKELNWFMDVLIQISPVVFVVGKLGITATALVILNTHQGVPIFNLLDVRHILYMLLSGYILLIIYELYLLGV